MWMQLRPRSSLVLLPILFSDLALASSGWELTEASSRMDLYSDDQITVAIPSISGILNNGEDQLDISYSADVISGATTTLSVDTISSATTFEETRHQLSASHNWVYSSDLRIISSVLASYEPDHLGVRAGVGSSVDLFESMTTLNVSYTYGHDAIGRAGENTFIERSYTNQADITVDQIVNSSTTLSLLSTFSYANCGVEFGCLSSPYRTVGYTTPTGDVLAAYERHPTTLVRAAVGAGFAKAIGNTLALHGGYRLYRDSWDVTGHSGYFKVTGFLFGERLMWRTSAGLSTTSEAGFYLNGLTSESGYPQEIRSADRELSGVASKELGVRVEWNFFGAGPFMNLRPNFRVHFYDYMYDYYAVLPSKQAIVTGVGVEGVF